MAVLAGVLSRRPADRLRDRVRAMMAPFRNTGPPPDLIGIDEQCVLAARPTPNDGSYLNVDDRISVVFDGRLDHTSELRSALGLSAAVPVAELIAAAYRRFGTEMFGSL